MSLSKLLYEDKYCFSEELKYNRLLFYTAKIVYKLYLIIGIVEANQIQRDGSMFTAKI